jgi:hypothetical protein
MILLRQVFSTAKELVTDPVCAERSRLRPRPTDAATIPSRGQLMPNMSGFIKQLIAFGSI